MSLRTQIIHLHQLLFVSIASLDLERSGIHDGVHVGIPSFPTLAASPAPNRTRLVPTSSKSTRAASNVAVFGVVLSAFAGGGKRGAKKAGEEADEEET